MNCPSDNAALHRHQYDNVQLHACGRCRGIWLDVRSLSRLLGTPFQKPGAAVVGKIGKRPCPQCRNAMRVRELHGITVDVCLKCEGIWLDVGELEAIVRRSEESSDARVSSGISAIDILDAIPAEAVLGAARALGQVLGEAISNTPDLLTEAGSAVLEFVAELFSGL